MIHLGRRKVLGGLGLELFSGKFVGELALWMRGVTDGGKRGFEQKGAKRAKGLQARFFARMER
jgi:hypothetical protein